MWKICTVGRQPSSNMMTYSQTLLTAARFDALLGYVSSLVGKQGLDSAEQNYWPANVHIIGKDILRFHAIYWPAMLLSGGFALPKQIFGHGLLTKDGMKMGKSLGNTIDPFELANSYGADAVRFYFLQAMEFGKDGDFSLERFIQSVNSDLANDIGNLLNRSLGLLKKRCNFELRKSAAEIDENHPMRLVVSRQVRGQGGKEKEKRNVHTGSRSASLCTGSTR